MKSVKTAAGVLIKDVPRYLRALARTSLEERDRAGWISICNRNERLLPAPDRRGVVCDWEWGSTLHAPLVFPGLGARLMSRALSDWPIRFATEPMGERARPELSFVFSHSGLARLPQLLKTIESINAQIDVVCEVVVIDQSAQSLRSRIPEHVRYEHLPPRNPDSRWNKSYGYNNGASTARGEILVFHDGDICVPARYALELVRRFETPDIHAASLQRFLFYLDRPTTETICATNGSPRGLTPDKIRQNWRGGTIAIRKSAFFQIGGFDESFFGWGGEDFEFFDRCKEVGHLVSGYLPFLHLWHPPQPSKFGEQRAQNLELMRRKLAMRRRDRISILLSGR